MSNSSWNAPTGPPNGAPVRPGDARRDIDDAIQHARAHDRELRAEVVAIAGARVRASDRLAAATDEAGEALRLAKRALTRSNESARAGQRADAAKWTAAAQVFAMRLRDARAEVAALEDRLAAASDQAQRAEQALAENVGRLQAVAAARLPTLSGRKAGRAQREVDEVVVAIGAPTADLVDQATLAARAAVDSVEPPAGGDPAEVPMSDDDLEQRGRLREHRRDPRRSARRAGPAGAVRPRAHRHCIVGQRVVVAIGRRPRPGVRAQGKGQGDVVPQLVSPGRTPLKPRPATGGCHTRRIA